MEGHSSEGTLCGEEDRVRYASRSICSAAEATPPLGGLFRFASNRTIT